MNLTNLIKNNIAMIVLVTVGIFLVVSYMGRPLATQMDDVMAVLAMEGFQDGMPMIDMDK